MTKKNLRRVFAAAAVAGTYVVMAPEHQSVNPPAERGPNETQQEFIRLVAQKYDYVALGDTAHDEPRIGMFGLHRDMVAALAAGGKTRLFLEAAPDTQDYFDKVAAGMETRTRWSDYNMWLCGATAQQAVSAEFESALRANPAIKFTAVDQRHSRDSDAAQGMNTPFMKYAVGVPLTVYGLVYGCVGMKAFIPAALAGAVTGVGIDDVQDILADDRDTVRKILSYPEGGGAIFYGAAHFDKKKQTMYSELTAAGRGVAHINIFRDRQHSDQGISVAAAEDALLLLTDEAGGDGIVAMVPEMEELHRQAVENVARRKQPAPRTGPEI